MKATDVYSYYARATGSPIRWEELDAKERATWEGLIAMVEDHHDRALQAQLPRALDLCIDATHKAHPLFDADMRGACRENLYKARDLLMRGGG